jgi:nitroreductase
MEAIRSRRSVRTFNGEPLLAEDAQKIMAFAETTENPYGLPIKWELLDAKTTGLSSPVIVGEDTFIAGKMRRVPYAEEAFGYSFERIVLFAESIGVGTTWIAGTMDRAAFEKAVSLQSDEVMPCVSPLGYPAIKMSVRESLMRKGVKADSRLAFSELFFDGSFDHPLSAGNAGKWQTALEAVRLAPSAVNKQPWRAVICGDRVHFYEKHGAVRVNVDWDIQKIDMGIALAHFALAAEACGLPVSFCLEDPGLSVPANTEYIATYAAE